MLNNLIKFSLLGILFFVPVYFAFWGETFNPFIAKQIIFHGFLALGLIFGWADFSVNNFAKNKTLFLIILALILSVLISSILSLHPNLSFLGSYARQEGFYSLISYLLFFSLAVFYFSKNFKLNSFFYVIFSAGFLVSFYGISQYLGLEIFNIKETEEPFSRIFSTLGQTNFLAHYLIMIIPLTAWGLVYLAKKNIARFLILILIFLELACLIFTASRAAWLGLIVSTGVFLGLLIYKKIKLKINYKILISGLFSLVLIFGLFNFFNLENRVKSIFDTAHGSNKVRLLTWGAAIDELKQADALRLLFGYGPDGLEDIFAGHYTSEWGINETINSYGDRAHNLILDNLLQFGIIGFLVVILFNIFIIFRAVKYLKITETNQEYYLIVAVLSILAGYFINNLFSFSLVVPKIYLYFSLALLYALTSKQSSFVIPVKTGIQENSLAQINLDSRFRGNDRTKFFVINFLIIILLSFLVYDLDIKLFQADYYYRLAAIAGQRNDCEALILNTEKAMQINSRQIEYINGYLKNGSNCLEKLNNLKERDELHKKIISQVNNLDQKEITLKTQNNIARAYAMLSVSINPNYYQIAQAKFQEIINFNPNFSSHYSDLAQVNLWHKDYEEAIKNLKLALKVIPSLDNTALNRPGNEEHLGEVKSELEIIYKYLAQGYFGLKDYEKALKYYNLALNLNSRNLILYKKIADIYYLEGDLNTAIWYNQRGQMLNTSDDAWNKAIMFLEKLQKNNE